MIKIFSGAYALRGDIVFEIIKAVFTNFLFTSENTNILSQAASGARERELLEKMKNEGDKKARQELIEHNLRLVSHIIKKYYSGYDEQEDLISIGTVGLIKAVDSFNADKGIRLATYAARCNEN